VVAHLKRGPDGATAAIGRLPWWEATVTDKGGRPSETVARPRDGLSMEAAETLLGFSNEQVSRAPS
jgi:hypothetical protein